MLWILAMSMNMWGLFHGINALKGCCEYFDGFKDMLLRDEDDFDRGYDQSPIQPAVSAGIEKLQRRYNLSLALFTAGIVWFVVVND